MRKILLSLFFGLLICGVHAQTVVVRNPKIEKLVFEVSSDSLKKYIYDLAAFNTRHTLSRDEKNGMPAAQRYVLSKFNTFAKSSNDRRD
jgi:hypothetical protein